MERAGFICLRGKSPPCFSADDSDEDVHNCIEDDDNYNEDDDDGDDEQACISAF